MTNVQMVVGGGAVKTSPAELELRVSALEQWASLSYKMSHKLLQSLNHI